MNNDLVTELRVLSGSRKIYPSAPHGQMVGMETYQIVANGFALECIDAASDEIESLHQQLAELVEANRIMCEDFAAENSKCAALEQQLSEALAAIKLKDESLGYWMVFIESEQDDERQAPWVLAAKEALAATGPKL